MTTQWLRSLTALPEGLSSLPITHTRQLTTACNSSSRGSDALFWPPRAPEHLWHLLTQTHSYISTHPCTEIHAYTYVPIWTHTHEYVLTCMSRHTCSFTCIQCTYTHVTYRHTFTHTHAETCTHAYVYTKSCTLIDTHVQ